MAVHIDRLAAVDSRAQLDDDVEIGPFCVVGPEARLGRGVRLVSHVAILGKVTLGRHNVLHPGVVIGGAPQDLSYRDEPTEVVIGDHNVLREAVTVNRGTVKDEGVTRIGSHCYLMGGVHVAHDCWLGDRIVIANATLLGGHVHVADDANLSGGIGVCHRVSIGEYSFVGGLSRVQHDVPPYMLCDGTPARPRCVNLVALKRNDFSAAVIQSLAEAHRLIYRERVGLDHTREQLRAAGQLTPAVNHLLGFLQFQHEGRHGRARETFRRAA